MSRILAIGFTSIFGTSLALGITQTVAEPMSAVAAFEGQPAAPLPLGLVAVAAGFLLAGGWLLWISARSRA